MPMKLVSFDAMRSFGIPGVTYVRPESWLARPGEIEAAHWLLFPQYWQVNALYYGLKKRIFPSIPTYHLGHDKVEMTRAFQAVCPANVPETLILAATDGSEHEVLDTLTFPFVAKEIRNSMGRGVHLVENRAQWRRYAQANDVWYVQEFLPLDRDMRLVVIGRSVVAAYWRRRAEGGFHTNVARGGVVDFDDVPPQAIRLVESTARRLDIDHAGFDVAQVGDRFYFFEFNRLFGARGLVEGGVSAGALIHAYLEQLSRPPGAPPREPPAPPVRKAS